MQRPKQWPGKQPLPPCQGERPASRHWCSGYSDLLLWWDVLEFRYNGGEVRKGSWNVTLTGTEVL